MESQNVPIFDGLSLTRMESQIVPSLGQCASGNFYAEVFESFSRSLRCGGSQGETRTTTGFE